MKLRVLLTSLVLALTGLAGPGVALSGAAHGATTAHSSVAKHKHHKKKHHKRHHKAKHHKKAGGGKCSPHYSGACVPIASDVDCAGGSGNGPKYVSGPVYVKDYDVYDLDADGDGVGCDS